jgi:hypothetical protein
VGPWQPRPEAVPNVLRTKPNGCHPSRSGEGPASFYPLFLRALRVSALILTYSPTAPVLPSSGNRLATIAQRRTFFPLDFSHGRFLSLQRKARLARPDSRLLPLAGHHHRRLGPPRGSRRSKISRTRRRNQHPTRQFWFQSRPQRRRRLRRSPNPFPLRLIFCKLCFPEKRPAQRREGSQLLRLMDKPNSPTKKNL